MPDYTKNKIEGLYLYFTSKCIVEAFHAHADQSRSQRSAAKFFIRSDGSIFVQKKGRLSEKQIKAVCRYIELNYMEMYSAWVNFGGLQEFYRM